MTLAKKGRRKIVVDDKNYHWRVMRNSDEAWAPYGAPGLYFVVERETSYSGSILICESGQLLDNGAITPHDVEHSIRAALRDGWKPEEPGKPFVVLLNKHYKDFQRMYWENLITPQTWTSDELDEFQNKGSNKEKLLDESIFRLGLFIIEGRHTFHSEIWNFNGFKYNLYEGGVYARHGDYFKFFKPEFKNINGNTYSEQMLSIREINHCESFQVLFSIAYRFLGFERKAYVLLNEAYAFYTPESIAEFSVDYMLKRFSKETLEEFGIYKFDRVVI